MFHWEDTYRQTQNLLDDFYPLWAQNFLLTQRSWEVLLKKEASVTQLKDKHKNELIDEYFGLVLVLFSHIQGTQCSEGGQFCNRRIVRGPSGTLCLRVCVRGGGGFQNTEDIKDYHDSPESQLDLEVYLNWIFFSLLKIVHKLSILLLFHLKCLSTLTSEFLCGFTSDI